MPATCAVTAIVTAFERPEATVSTLRRILACEPRPAELLVHVDAGRHELAALIATEFPDARVMVSNEQIGPGGGRNKLLREAREELVASFDDDSHPADADYFQRVLDSARANPEAAVIGATILDELASPPPARTTEVANFVGCGCVYRRAAFLRTSGYVPLPVAYGMEETDLSIRLHAMHLKIIHDPSLRVVHDMKPATRETDTVAAAMVANVALLAWLRYPVVLWPLGAAQVLRKAAELLLRGRWSGVLRGLAHVPAEARKYREYRALLHGGDILSHIRLRRALEAGRP